MTKLHFFIKWLLPSIVFFSLYNWSGPAYVMCFLIALIVFREQARELLIIGAGVLSWAVLPDTLFFALWIFVFLCLVRPERSNLRYRLELHMSRVAIAQAVAFVRQLGMELTSYSLDFDFNYLMLLDQKPQYYRQFRKNLSTYLYTLAATRETVPLDLRRGFDYHAMSEVCEAASKVAVERDVALYKAGKAA